MEFIEFKTSIVDQTPDSSNLCQIEAQAGRIYGASNAVSGLTLDYKQVVTVNT